jgi:glyoxylase-like metal-dependent hydrolase (beta-lactamase superfamily II)
MRIHRIPGFFAHSYLIETPDALFLVDGGMLGTGRHILRRITSIGRRPEQLEFALVTHAHIDHFGGLAAVQKASGCAILCHPEHVDALRAGGGGLVSPGLTSRARLYERIAGFVLPKVRLPRLEQVSAIGDGASARPFGLAGRFLHTPGHSTGCLTLVLDAGDAFVGDLVQGSRAGGVVPPEFSIMAVDERGMLASWRALIESGATRLFPGHGGVVSIDRIMPVFHRANAARALLDRLTAAAAEI